MFYTGVPKLSTFWNLCELSSENGMMQNQQQNLALNLSHQVWT